ncbi:MAG: T9SS type A sorting domain-containing protein [Raineya sp.]|nr:T9SS type A sorting domain-containing protein [Raineya sp.]
MKQFLSQKYKNAVGKYKKFKARFEKKLKEGVSAHQRRSLYQRLKKLYNQILRLETQLKWAVSAGALSVALTALPNLELSAQSQGKFKYVERNVKLSPKTGYVAASAPTYPTFADLDGDGDKDLIIGLAGGGALYYQRNDDTGKPVYTLLNSNDIKNPFRNAAADMAGVNYFNPSFADMDGDGDLDMIVGTGYIVGGNYYGIATLFKNVDGNFVDFTGPANPFINVATNYSYLFSGAADPEMIDKDGDGDLDLFISGYEDKYTAVVKYAENIDLNTGVFQEKTGSANPLNSASSAVVPLSAIAPNNGRGLVGYVNLTFADADKDGDLDAFVSEKYGAVYEFKNNGNNTFSTPTGRHPTLSMPLLPATVVPVNNFVDYYSWAIHPTFQDFDNDGDLDVIYGDKYLTTLPYKKNNGSGVFTLVSNNVNAPANVDFKIEQNNNPLMPSISSAAIANLDSDSDLDILSIGHTTPAALPQVRLLRNEGDDSFTIQNNPTLFPSLGGTNNFPTIDLADFDGDGDSDLLVKALSAPTPRYFRNNNNANFTELTGSSNPFNGVSISNLTKIQMVDIDGDSDLDLVAGDGNAIRVFRNNNPGFTELTGTYNPFSSINAVIASATTPAPGYRYSSPTLVDVDGDGDLDLLLGFRNTISNGSTELFNQAKIYYYKNNNGVYEANVAENPFNNVSVVRMALIDAGDVDGDGDLDVVIGERNTTNSQARIRYFERVGNNFCPKVQEILREINTNQTYEFTKEEFRDAYSDEPDTKNKDFPKIKIIFPPAYGKLMIGGEIATAGLEIPYAGLDNMVYIPNNGYTGIDNFVWAAYDPVGECYSNGGNFRFGVGTDVTAINDDLVGSVVVFPNPSKDKFNINLDKNLSGKVEVKLYNTLGGVVHSATYQNPADVRSIDVSKLPNGLYILQISNEGKNGVFKLVKE